MRSLHGSAERLAENSHHGRLNSLHCGGDACREDSEGSLSLVSLDRKILGHPSNTP